MGERVEGILRVSSMVLAAMSAAIVGFAEETQTVFFMRKKATARNLQILWVFTIIASVVCGYHLLQFCRFLTLNLLRKNKPQLTSKFWAWIWLLLDQGVTYAMFGVTAAATQGSMVALRGVKQFQWTKLCNIYGKFCGEVAGGLLCGFVASFAMAVVSFFSARNFFKFCSVYHREKISSPKKWSWNLFYSSFS